MALLNVAKLTPKALDILPLPPDSENPASTISLLTCNAKLCILVSIGKSLPNGFRNVNSFIFKSG
jgi:hypothetical protein